MNSIQLFNISNFCFKTDNQPILPGISMLTMNKTVYVVTKALTACLTLFLLIVASTCVYLALRAIYGATVNPEISLLLVPGILILI